MNELGGQDIRRPINGFILHYEMAGWVEKTHSFAAENFC